MELLLSESYRYKNITSVASSDVSSSKDALYMNALFMNSSNESITHFVHTEHGHGLTNRVELITYMCAAPILITFGILSNILMCFTLRKPCFRNISLCAFLYAYSVSNILSLVFNSSVEWLSDITIGRHFYNYSETVCRVWQFLIRLVAYSGGWFMVAMTLDRFLAVWFPRRAKSLCSVFFAKAIISFIMVGLTTISAHALWLFQLTNGWCYIDNSSIFYTHFWLVLGMQYSVVPLCLMFFFGVLAYIGIRRRDVNTTEISNERIKVDITSATILNSFLYFTLNTPATVINVIDNYSPREWRNSTPVINHMEVSRDISHSLVLINYASGIVVWLTCSHVFKSVIKEIIFRKPKINRNGVISTEL